VQAALFPKVQPPARHTDQEDNEDTAASFSSSKNKSKATLSDLPDLVAESKISVPEDVDVLAHMQDAESLAVFSSKACPPHQMHGNRAQKCEVNEGKGNHGSLTDCQVLACLLAELFAPKKFLCLGEDASSAARLAACEAALRADPAFLPACIRPTVAALLNNSIY